MPIETERCPLESRETSSKTYFAHGRPSIELSRPEKKSQKLDLIFFN